MPEPASTSAPSTPANPTPGKPAVRTYASDVAKLTGQPLAQNVKNELPLQKPASVAAPVTTPPPPLPKPSEPVQTPPGTPTPQPAPPPAQAIFNPPPAKIIPKAPSTEESRESVLERLKAKAAAAAPQEAAPSTAFAPTPKAPSTSETREEILARLKGNAGAPAGLAKTSPQPPAPKPRETARTAESSPLHTYKTDFADESTRQGASRISMLAAEQDRGAVPVVLPQKKRGNALVLAAGVVLIVAGMGSIYITYRFLNGQPPVPQELAVPSLIAADERIEVKGAGSELRDELLKITRGSLQRGEVVVAYLTVSTTTKEGTTTTIPAEGGLLVSALGLPAPDILLRNIGAESTVGVIKAGEDAYPFFILTVASYERTFSGMLAWESSMERDLRAFYPAYPSAPFGELSTSTPVVEPIRPGFTDEVVANHDVRLLRDAAGRTLLLYGYRDKETLIIARDEEAFSELLTRLAASRR